MFEKEGTRDWGRYFRKVERPQNWGHCLEAVPLGPSYLRFLGAPGLALPFVELELLGDSHLHTSHPLQGAQHLLFPEHRVASGLGIWVPGARQKPGYHVPLDSTEVK